MPYGGMRLACARATLLALVLAAASFARATPYEARCAAIAAAKESRPEAERLHDLFAASWEHRLDEFPELATRIGVPPRTHE